MLDVGRSVRKGIGFVGAVVKFFQRSIKKEASLFLIVSLSTLLGCIVVSDVFRSKEFIRFRASIRSFVLSFLQNFDEVLGTPTSVSWCIIVLVGLDSLCKFANVFGSDL